MNCPICKHGETIKGYATVVLERSKTTLIVKHVPADICNNCGEEFIDENVSIELVNVAKQAMELGVYVNVREYLAAV
ncbi:MAG: type II toxin-antitoxin system MqsA family antitoxin [Methylococcaceae bacterium]